MREVVPSIMDVILLTAIKILKFDPKEAMTALSTYLKNTSHRAASKKEKSPTANSLVVGQDDGRANGQMESGNEAHDVTDDDGDDNDYSLCLSEMSE